MKKCWLITTLVIVQALALPRQASGQTNKDSTNVTSKAHSNKTDSPHSSTIEKPPAPDTSKNAGSDNRGSEIDKPTTIASLPEINVKRDRFDCIYLLLNILLVVVGVATLIGIWYQAIKTAEATQAVRDSLPHQKAAAEAAQKAAEVSFLNIEAFKNKERARLTVRPSYKETLNTFEEDSADAVYFAGQNYPEAGIEISQKGPTMAFNVAGRFTLMSSPDRTPPPSLNPNMTRMNIATEIEGNAREPELATVILSGCDTEAVANGTLFIHFFGVVTYVDVFDGPHYVRFRYVWIPTRYEWLTDEDGDIKGPDYDRISEEGHWAQHGPPEDNQAA